MLMSWSADLAEKVSVAPNNHHHHFQPAERGNLHTIISSSSERVTFFCALLWIIFRPPIWSPPSKFPVTCLPPSNFQLRVLPWPTISSLSVNFWFIHRGLLSQFVSQERWGEWTFDFRINLNQVKDLWGVKDVVNW